jgi:hypothetical protein
MKNKLLFLMLLASSALFAQSIPNGGFENWTMSTWLDPQYYNSSNDEGNHGGTISSSTIPPPNVTQTTGKYGKYGVQVASVKIGNDTMPGYFIDANTNNGLTGGIPYNQKPTGIRFWYKYTTTGIDTAAVLVFFKNSGNIIDSFLITIPSSASTSTYTLYSYHPKNPLPLTPDSIIFGAASSKAVINQHNNYSTGIIPGSTFTIDSVTFTGVSAQPAELNGNFENWVTDTVNIPNGWYVGTPGITQTTDHYAGSYALQLATVSSPNNGISVGQASTGYYPNNCNSNCYEQGGYAFTNQVDTLTFWYKYLPKPNDTASVWMNFIKKGAGIYGQGINITTAASVWTYASVPFNVGQAPDTVVVNINPSQHNNDTSNAQYAPYVGTIFKIDNMAFKSQPLAVVNIQQPVTGMKIYPNPAGQILNIDLNSANEPTGATVLIMDVLGNETMQAKPDFSKGTVSLNISELASGIYFIKVITDNSTTIAKFIKQ